MPVCGVCLREVDRLVESHVIPKAITREMQGKGGQPLATLHLRNAPRGNPVTKSFGGIYAQIACATCEHDHFQAADRYLVEFRRRLVLKRTKYRPHPQAGLRLREHVADAHLLHRFAIQTIFRAHLSPRSECGQVDLGSYEALFRSLVVSPESTLTVD